MKVRRSGRQLGYLGALRRDAHFVAQDGIVAAQEWLAALQRFEQLNLVLLLLDIRI